MNNNSVNRERYLKTGGIALHTWGFLLFALLIMPMLLPAAAVGQEVPGGGRQEALRVFLDGNYFRIGFDFIRTEIEFVEWVRDQADADVHIIVTEQQAGSGGNAYTLDFIGKKEFEGRTDRVVHTSSQTDTRDEVRSAFVRVLKLGLVPYILKTPAGRNIDLSYRIARERAEERMVPEHDPWNYWIFRTSLSGNLESERAQSQYSTNGSFSARRVTEDWKIQLECRGDYSENRYELSGGTVKNFTHTVGFTGLVVRSLGGHWSAGIRTNANSSTRLNQKLSIRLAPAVEYNFFPYSEFTRRQLTLQYAAGANSFLYETRTLYGESYEVLYNQSLALTYEVTQPWGSTNATIEGAHFFHDPEKYHVNISGRCDIRLFRGLSLNISGRASRVHDQLYIASSGYTDEEILTRIRKLQTAYEYDVRIGFSYTFGSIFNTVVNPRLQDPSRGERGRMMGRF